MLKIETASQRTAPNLEPYFIKSGAVTKFENSRVIVITPTAPIGAAMLARTKRGERGESAPCRNRLGLKYDIYKILELGIKYPKFKNYFAEKINKIRRLEYLLQNRRERVKGETKEFLNYYVKHFSRQIKNVCDWLEDGKN